MPVTRVYRAVFNNQVRIVEASHPNAAVAHLARQLLTEIRPATPKEVADHYRSGAQVEVAGAEPAPVAEKPEWPVGGDAGPKAGNAMMTEFSADGSDWHSLPQAGDTLMRHSHDGRDWVESPIAPVVATGESAD